MNEEWKCFCTDDRCTEKGGCPNIHDGAYGQLCKSCAENHAEEYYVNEKNDETALIPTDEEEKIEEQTELTESQIDVYRKNMQLSGEEEVVATGSDIMKIKKYSSELENEEYKKHFKLVYPFLYKKIYGED